ncbi:MAG: TraR/DksA family transcriptional regulator [Jatrophihabitans sp.]
MTTRFIPGAADRARTTDDDPLDHFRQALQEQRRFRIEQLDELDAAAGLPDPAGALSEVTATLRLAARTALSEVDAALARLETGHYGRCLQCDREIIRQRLEILPMAALCMSCQRSAEAAGRSAGAT